VPFTSSSFGQFPGPLAHSVQRLLQIDQLEDLYDSGEVLAGVFSALLKNWRSRPGSRPLT
jgi:hypothetical protein